MAETGKVEKEEKSLEWCSEQRVGLEGLFLSKDPSFPLQQLWILQRRERGLGGELGCRAEQEQQTKRESGQCFVPPPRAGNQPEETRQRSSLLSLALPLSPAVPFLLVSLFERPVEAGERRTERWRCGGGGECQLVPRGLCRQLQMLQHHCKPVSLR